LQLDVRAARGTRHPVAEAVEICLIWSRHVQFEGVTASKHPYVRQKLAQFAIESRLPEADSLPGLTAQLKKRIPGPETSRQLHATELNLRVQMFADELLGPFHQLRSNSAGAVEGGRWLGRFLTARGMTIAAGSRRSSTTSSGAGAEAAQRLEHHLGSEKLAVRKRMSRTRSASKPRTALALLYLQRSG